MIWSIILGTFFGIFFGIFYFLNPLPGESDVRDGRYRDIDSVAKILGTLFWEVGEDNEMRAYVQVHEEAARIVEGWNERILSMRETESRQPSSDQENGLREVHIDMEEEEVETKPLIRKRKLRIEGRGKS